MLFILSQVTWSYSLWCKETLWFNLFDSIFASCSSVRPQRFLYNKGIVWEELLLFLELQTRRLVWANIFTEMITYFPFSALHNKTCNSLTVRSDSLCKLEFRPASQEICNLGMHFSFLFCLGCPSSCVPHPMWRYSEAQTIGQAPTACVYVHPPYTLSLAKETWPQSSLITTVLQPPREEHGS